MRLEPVRTGLVHGLLVALGHLAWIVLVASGFAQTLINLVLAIHFLQVSVTVAPFNVVTALVLVGVTFVVGLAIGIVFSLIWNAVQRAG